MRVTVTRRADSGAYTVRWRENGKRPRRDFDRKGDAEDFAKATERRIAMRGMLDPRAGEITLADFFEEYWRAYAIPNNSERTRKTKAYLWNKHLRPRIGGMALLDITPAVVEDLRAQLHIAGVGDPTIIKALGILQGVMKRAVVRGRIAANPVREVDKPRQTGVQRIDPLAPSSVEAIRALMKPYDATLVSVIAYAGLRPEEAINVEARHIGDKTLYVPRRKSRGDRYVDLLPVLGTDLREWLMFAGIRSGLIFPRTTGNDWTEVDWRNWYRRVYRPAAVEAGVTGDMRAYRLRGSYGSLLLWEGRSTTYVANQLGHSVATLSKHYAGVIAELEVGAERVGADETIRQARGKRSALPQTARKGPRDAR